MWRVAPVGSPPSWRRRRAPRWLASTTTQGRSPRQGIATRRAASSMCSMRTIHFLSKMDRSTRCSRTIRPIICVTGERHCASGHVCSPAGGRVLYTEGLVLTGPISNEEVAGRTFMGYFVLTPPGENERAIEEAGLKIERDGGSFRRRDRGRDADVRGPGAPPGEPRSARRREDIRGVPELHRPGPSTCLGGAPVTVGIRRPEAVRARPKSRPRRIGPGDVAEWPKAAAC